MKSLKINIIWETYNDFRRYIRLIFTIKYSYTSHNEPSYIMDGGGENNNIRCLGNG